MRLIDLEIKRQTVREKEREQQAGSSAGADRAAEKEKEKRYRLVLRKQEKLLYVCFHVLLNLAEEPAIEKKMAKRGNRRRFQIALLDGSAPCASLDHLEAQAAPTHP